MRVLCLFVVLSLGLAPPVRAEDSKKPDPHVYQVPYRLTETKHVLVRAKINGKGPFNFIVDTGAPSLFVATNVCRKLGIQASKGGWATFERFEIEGGVVVPKAKGRIEDPFQLEGMNGLGLAGAELHGIIGYTILARYRLEFDFTRDKMAWTRLNFDPPLPPMLGEQAMPGGLDAVASMMKLAGALLGTKTEPQVQPRGFLGLELADTSEGVQVRTVLANSPAAEAGVQVGDRIRRFQDQAVKSQADVQRLAAKLTAGQKVELSVSRATGEQTLRLQAGKGL